MHGTSSRPYPNIWVGRTEGDYRCFLTSSSCRSYCPSVLLFVCFQNFDKPMGKHQYWCVSCGFARIEFPEKCISADPIISPSVAICIASFKTVFARSLIYVGSKIRISWVVLLKWPLNPKCWQHHSAGHQNFNLGKLKKKRFYERSCSCFESF